MNRHVHRTSALPLVVAGLLLLAAGAASADCPSQEAPKRMRREHVELAACLERAGVPRVPVPRLRIVQGQRWPQGSEKDGGSSGACCFTINGGRKVWGWYDYRCGVVVAPAGGEHVWMHEDTHHHLWLRFRDLDYDHDFRRPGFAPNPWHCWSDILTSRAAEAEARR